MRCSSSELRMKFLWSPAFFPPCLECLLAAFVRIREARQNQCALAAFSVERTVERTLSTKAHHVEDCIDLDQTGPLQRRERAPDLVSPSLSRRDWAFARGLCSEMDGATLDRLADELRVALNAAARASGKCRARSTPMVAGRAGVSDLSSSWKATDGAPPASARRMPSQICCRRERGPAAPTQPSRFDGVTSAFAGYAGIPMSDQGIPLCRTAPLRRRRS